MVCLPLLLCCLLFIKTDKTKITVDTTSKDSLVFTVVNLHPKEEKKIAQIQPKEKPSHKIKTENNKAIVIVKDSLVIKIQEKDTTTLTSNLKANNGTIANADTAEKYKTNNSGTGIKLGGPITSDSTHYLTDLDAQPEYDGGSEKMYDYLYKNINYTACARENHIKGKIFVSFVINSAGEVVNVKLLNKLGCGLDEQVLATMEKMPKWKSGVFRGKKVSTILTLPVVFDLK